LQNDFEVHVENAEHDVHAAGKDTEEVREIVSKFSLVIKFLAGDGSGPVKNQEDVRQLMRALADAIRGLSEQSRVGREGRPIHKGEGVGRPVVIVHLAKISCRAEPDIRDRGGRLVVGFVMRAAIDG